MKNSLLVLFSITLLFTFTRYTHAQEAANENTALLQFYDNELFRWDIVSYGGLRLNLGDQNWKYDEFKVNIKNETIRNALHEYPDSAQAYNLFTKNAITANILYWTGFAFLLGAFVPLYTVDDAVLALSLSGGLCVGGIVTATIGFKKFGISQSSLFTAANIYNRYKVREYNK